eukprot:1280839-Prymnesium_polylepis.1
MRENNLSTARGSHSFIPLAVLKYLSTVEHPYGMRVFTAGEQISEYVPLKWHTPHGTVSTKGGDSLPPYSCRKVPLGRASPQAFNCRRNANARSAANSGLVTQRRTKLRSFVAGSGEELDDLRRRSLEIH